MTRRSLLRVSAAALAFAVSLYVFLAPGLAMLRDLRDPAIHGPGIPERARELHEVLTPRIATWARERIGSGDAVETALHDVPTNEWPLFTVVFYLLGTDALDAAHEGDPADAPGRTSHAAIEASLALLLDENHHDWVRRHWGDDYLHRENVFFRALLIAGLTRYESLAQRAEARGADGAGGTDEAPWPGFDAARRTRARGLLLDQVTTLANDLDTSPRGLLDDYPGECYPIDVLVAIGWIRDADRVLGTDHRAFVERALRAFTGPHADGLGLVPFRVTLPDASQDYGPARGIGNAWVSVYAPDLWPDEAARWYATFTEHYWRDEGWAAGFREFRAGMPEWTFEIDAGPVLDGLGTSANAFGIAAARKNGRFDHAATLHRQLAAASWTLPDGTLGLPRLVSHAAAAPYLGEAGIFYFLTVQPAEGVPLVRGGTWPGLVWFGFLVFFGVPLVAFLRLRREWRAARTGTGSAGDEVYSGDARAAYARSSKPRAALDGDAAGASDDERDPPDGFASRASGEAH